MYLFCILLFIYINTFIFIFLLYIANPMYNKLFIELIIQYGDDISLSHACIFTLLWLVKILTSALEISPHIVC